VKQPKEIVQTIGSRPRVLEGYSSCTALVENDGHPFGESLPATDKKALIAFLATM
jgi:hypothetical protein